MGLILERKGECRTYGHCHICGRKVTKPETVTSWSARSSAEYRALQAKA